MMKKEKQSLVKRQPALRQQQQEQQHQHRQQGTPSPRKYKEMMTNSSPASVPVAVEKFLNTSGWRSRLRMFQSIFSSRSQHFDPAGIRIQQEEEIKSTRRRRTVTFKSGMIGFIVCCSLRAVIVTMWDWNNTTGTRARVNYKAARMTVEWWGGPKPRILHAYPTSTIENSRVNTGTHRRIYDLPEVRFSSKLEQRKQMRRKRSNVDQDMPDDPRTRKTCDYLGDWQYSHRPNCIAFHEIDLGQFFPQTPSSSNIHKREFSKKQNIRSVHHHRQNNHNHDTSVMELLRLVNNGSFRDVWSLVFATDKRERVALKTLRYIQKRDFSRRNLDRHRRDAMAHEQLTSSPYVANIYGHCANSAVFDYSSGRDLFQIFDKEERKNNKIDKWDVLKIAIDVVYSVHDAHHFTASGQPTMAHTDIKPDQWIEINGSYRLNDFNRARFLTWDRVANETCPFDVAKNGGIWRAPEEYKYEPETHKVDIWSMGNVLLLLWAGETPFQTFNDEENGFYMEKDKIIDEIRRGNRPPVPRHVLHSTHPVDEALKKALEMCYVADPSKRVNALQVARVLEKALAWQTTNKKQGKVKK